MDRRIISYALYGIGFSIVAMSWLHVVSNTVGWCGWGVGIIGVIIRPRGR